MPKRRQKSDINAYRLDINCETKRIFKDEAEALHAAEDRMFDYLGLEIAVYQCPVCRQWHLTSITSAESNGGFRA